MEPKENDAVWAQTTAGGMLHDLFGYFPTLHDARIRALEIDRQADSVVMVVDYSDLVEDGQPQLCVRMRLEWSGLHELRLHQRENYLYGMEVSTKGRLIVTEFEPALGTYGRVVAERFEVVLVQVDPPTEDGDENHTVELTLR